MRKPSYLFAIFLVLNAGLLFSTQSMAAQTGEFAIAQHGQSVGTATVTFAQTGPGYDTTSLVKVAMKGLNYSLSKNEELTAGNQLRHAQLSATVNNQAVNVTVAPDATQFLLSVSANGRSSTVRLPSHTAAVFLPDFDPGALDTLLAVAAAKNNRGLWAILPKQSGTQPASVAPIELATYADMEGTLNGKSIAVHHLVATIAGAKSELFSGPSNQLLQAELPQPGFAVVRKGFILTPPAKAGAPPAQAAQPGPPAAAPQPPVQQ